MEFLGVLLIVGAIGYMLDRRFEEIEARLDARSGSD